MSFKIDLLPNFSREARRLLKKYPSLKQDLAELVASLANNPTQGTSLGQNCYKIRLAIRSKQQGKSGGARVITCLLRQAETLTLLSIYDKAEQADIPDKLLTRLIEEANLL